MENEYGVESYLHKYSKDVMKLWLPQYKKFFGLEAGKLTMMAEYPIVKSDIIDSSLKSWTMVDFGSGLGKIPSYEEVKQFTGRAPVAIADLAVISGDIPVFFIEIRHRNPLSVKKVATLFSEFPKINMIEIRARWIMNQIKPPKKMRFRLFLGSVDEKVE